MTGPLVSVTGPVVSVSELASTVETLVVSGSKMLGGKVVASSSHSKTGQHLSARKMGLQLGM